MADSRPVACLSSPLVRSRPVRARMATRARTRAHTHTHTHTHTSSEPPATHLLSYTKAIDPRSTKSNPASDLPDFTTLGPTHHPSTNHPHTLPPRGHLHGQRHEFSLASAETAIHPIAARPNVQTTVPAGLRGARDSQGGCAQHLGRKSAHPLVCAWDCGHVSVRVRVCRCMLWCVFTGACVR